MICRAVDDNIIVSYYDDPSLISLMSYHKVCVRSLRRDSGLSIFQYDNGCCKSLPGPVRVGVDHVSCFN